MLPFYPYIGNQGNGAPNAPLPQQGTGNPNNGMPNFMPLQGQPQLVFNPNPQNPPPFNNPNSVFRHGNQGSMQNDHLGKSLLGSAPVMPQQTNGGFGPQNLNAFAGLPMNGPVGNLVAQNLLSGLLASGSINGLNPNAALVNAQLAFQNQLQSVNQLLNMALSNPSQLGSFNPMVACGNQVAQGPIPPMNGAFPGNPQLGMLQPNGYGQQVNLGQQNSFPPVVGGNALKQFPPPNQQMQLNSIVASSSGSSLPPNSQPLSPQVTQGNRNRMNPPTPNHRHNNTFNRDHKGGASNWRSPNTQNQYSQKMNGKQKFSNESREKAGSIKDSGTEVVDSSRNDLKGGKRRAFVTQYSEKEIQQWREERRKYYPTNANVQKKQLNDGKNSGDAEQEAELRRQQLKNILAKQAEMGFEVPEIPQHYLADSETKALGSDERKRPLRQNERFQNRFNKRGRFDCNEPFKARGPVDKKPFEKHAHFASKQGRQDGNGTWKAHQNTRKPSLLEKLMTEDLKRDRSRLLQAFRFMVMNSFLEDDSKPLKFPKVMVKETSFGVAKIEELDDLEDPFDDETAKNEAEEGELTE